MKLLLSDFIYDEIKKLGRLALALRCDVSDEVSVHSMVQRVAGTFGGIDILVNNTGIGDPKGPSEPETWEERQESAQQLLAASDRQTKGHISGAARFREGTRDVPKERPAILWAVVESMASRQRHFIVNVTSVVACFSGSQALSACSISKRAIVMATEGLVVDLTRFNIRVNAIAPGGIETELIRDVWATPKRAEVY